MAHASTTEDPRTIPSELHFQGVEWCKLGYAVVPSPDAIRQTADRIREEKGYVRTLDYELDEDLKLPAALIQRAIDDIGLYVSALRGCVCEATMRSRVREALKAIGWLFVSSPPGKDHLSFEEVCYAAGVQDCDSMRHHIRERLALDQDVVQHLLAHCN